MLSTKLLNKKTNKKLKSVTIIHSATTETVRLPEDNNGVIVHTAVRTKVPLKQKVRGQRKKNSAGETKGKLPTEKANASSGDRKEANATATTTAAAAGVVRPKRKKTGAVRSQQPSHQKQQHHHQKKLLSLYKSKASKKEIIDYSKRCPDKATSSPGDLSAIGKVQKWLLESPSNAGNDGENSSIISGDVLQSNNAAAIAMETLALKKSASTPERLTSPGNGGGGGVGVLKKKPTGANGGGKSAYHGRDPSVQQEKVKLQVVYKPPFKFSLKLKKRSPAVATTTVVSPHRAKKAAAGSSGNKSRGDGKNRIGIMSSSSQDKSTILRKNRLALLIRKEQEEEQAHHAAEPSTSRAATDNVLLVGKTTTGGGGGGELNRHYETMEQHQQQQQLKPVNSATFRIKKSSSSGNASQLEQQQQQQRSSERKRGTLESSTMKSNNSRDSLGAGDTMTTMTSSDRSRDISIKSSGGAAVGSSALRNQFGGSSGNLVMRSSTTNLAKLSGGGGGGAGFQKNDQIRTSLNMQRQLSSPADVTFKRASDSNSNVLLGRNATATSIQNNLQNGNMIMFKKLSTSNTNLAKFSDEFLNKRASNSSLNNFGVARRSSDRKHSHTPRRRASINSHRQSTTSGSRTGGSGSVGGGGGAGGSGVGGGSSSGTFDRRASMGSHNTKKSKDRRERSGGNSTRPHTATCDTDRGAPFEWPPPPPPPPIAHLTDPLPSDMEVLCSDVEHAFQDR